MSTVDDRYPAGSHLAPSHACPECRLLSDRIIELETRHTEARSESQANPPFALKAMRLLDVGWGAEWGLRPASPRREWMNASPHAYKCLPMVIANQWGWQVLSPTDVRVTWDGSPDLGGLRVEVDPQYATVVKSQFGSGIVTFSPPWLFRTSPGWDLFAKGPSNSWKPNCMPLEGIVETWWLNYTFTFNWKLVEPGSVTFVKGECVGQLVPVPHGTFDQSSAVQVPIEPEVEAELLKWAAERERRASDRLNTHSLYRRADDIEEHLVRVSVPTVKTVPTVETGNVPKPISPEAPPRDLYDSRWSQQITTSDLSLGAERGKTTEKGQDRPQG